MKMLQDFWKTNNNAKIVYLMQQLTHNIQLK